MTEERGSEAAREEQVRRLLAAARHDGPVPDDVVARVDAALAAEREAAPHADELADRRRRRRWTGGLAAAALVVVAGIGAGATGLLGAGSGSDAGSGDDVGAADSSAGGADAGADAGAGAGPDVGERSEDGAPSTESRAAGAPRVRPGPTFAADVRAAVAGSRDEVLAFSADASCAPADARGRVVGVRYDGSRAELVVGPASDGAREVALWLCGPEPVLERTLLLPAD